MTYEEINQELALKVYGYSNVYLAAREVRVYEIINGLKTEKVFNPCNDFSYAFFLIHQYSVSIDQYHSLVYLDSEYTGGDPKGSVSFGEYSESSLALAIYELIIKFGDN